ncbi:tetratricopeptide repeat protein [Dickeya fangzhongdai]|uniref:tetratricopeptide repeat protein n=1 Tax=Dickeya fangzhongdai TaxID=1778540 RepID=UPI0026DFABE3|nr:tetratricopeptide repeat protein [Dickeya fangzhongdai]WKV51505.1 NB-ARC domain-containing protein [Dickeya fangzhongdai]
MAFNLTRMTVYALLCALEEDLRSIVITYILNPENIEKKLPVELLEKAKRRLEKDIGTVINGVDPIDLVEYFDLGDTYQVINSNGRDIPEHIYKFIKSITKDLDALVLIRNRVMHIRPLDVEDYPTLVSICDKIKKSDINCWSNLVDVTDKININPSFLFSMEIKNYDEEINNHNLPLPDFDETGLIGRQDDVKKIKQLCYGAFPVISIVGEGGVGKTALALKVAYEILEDDNNPFDAIVWVSSKTTQITVNEIKEIKEAISDSIGIIQEISNQIIGVNTNQSNFNEIIDYLATFKIILFIDNLETILDDNIREFVGALPQGSKIVITSRIGLGAFEYPVKLQGIEESHASQLMRLLSKIRGVSSLEKINEKVSRSYVNRMSRNPSYIKWFVSSVQTGLSPESVLQNSNMFLDFCMSNVYEYLSVNARTLTAALQCAPGLKDVPELSYLTGFDSLQTHQSIQELMSTNMLSQSSKTKGASVKTTYQLSELARLYLGKNHKPSQTYQRSIHEKRNKLNALFEKQMMMRNEDKYNPLNIKFRDKTDRVIVKMLRDAQSFIRNGHHDKAFELLTEAHKLSPDYFEVARVMAYLHQQNGAISNAREQYELAIVLSPDTPQLHYWFARFLLREEDNTDDALTQINLAHDLDPNSIEVSLTLSRVYMFQHRFDEAEKTLMLIEPDIENSSEHNVKIFKDTQIQIAYRRADDSAQKGEYSDAMSFLEDMRNLFDELPDFHKDIHIRKKLSKCDFLLKTISRSADQLIIHRADMFRTWLERECA